MYIHERPEHLGHPLSKGLENFIQGIILNPIKSIDGLSGREEQEAIQTIEQELEDEGEEPDNDTFETREDEAYEQYDDEGGYNTI